MTVVHDAATKSGSGWTTTPDPFTFSHTPVGTPRGVVVLIAQNGASNDQISGVTYGGVAMTRITSASSTAGESGRTYAYFLGASIPTGAQTISIDHTAAAQGKIAECVTVTAAADTEILVSGILENILTDPQIALDAGATSALRYFVIFSGLAAVGNLTLVANCTAIDSHDAGAQVIRWDRQTNASTGSFTGGYTAASDDVAMVAIAIQEVAAAALATPSTVVALAAIPTPTVLAGSSVQPVVVASLVTVPTPSVSTGSTVMPSVVVVVVSVPTPVASAAVPSVVQSIGLGTSRVRRYSFRRIKNRPAMWGR